MGDFYYGRAVIEGKIQYLSVSSMEKFDHNAYGGCNAKWWLRYIGGHKEEETKAKEFGTKMHAQIKHYLQTGEDVLHERVRAGLKYIPAPKTVDAEFHLVPDGDLSRALLSYADVPFTGDIDVINRTGSYIDEHGGLRPLAGIEVIDWKTTKNIELYAKSAQALTESIQMMGYADAMNRLYGVDRVRLSHVYFQSADAKCAEKRTIEIGLEQIKSARYKHEQLVTAMQSVAGKQSPAEVPHNPNSCWAYKKPCPYQNVCPHYAAQSPARRVAMGLMDKIKANRTTSTPPPAPTTLSVSGPQTGGIQFETPAVKTAEAAPTSAPISTQMEAHNVKVGDTLSQGEVVTKDLGNGVVEVTEAPKKRGRKPKVTPVVGGVEVAVVDPSPGTDREPEPQDAGLPVLKVKQVTMRHSFTAKIGDSYAKVECEMVGDVSGDVDAASQELGDKVRATLQRELEVYVK